MALSAKSTVRSCSGGAWAQTSVILGTFGRLASMKSLAPWYGPTVSTLLPSFCASASALSGSARPRSFGIEGEHGEPYTPGPRADWPAWDLAALGDASRARHHAVPRRTEAGEPSGLALSLSNEGTLWDAWSSPHLSAYSLAPL
jgi:hypothetical protein